VNDFVAATPSSGPARQSSTASDWRAKEDHGAFVIATVAPPIPSRARSRSAVSPDWESATVRSAPGATAASNSEAIVTLVGSPVSMVSVRAMARDA
jgi:hypothetical protein